MDGPPSYVGVGTQKAGTTWWFWLIHRHPGAFRVRGTPKERHFFDRFWRHPFTGENIVAYHRQFPRPAGAVTGEWTPRYVSDFWTPPLLHAAAPDAKILVLLRDPVERYRSGLTHALDTGAPRAMFATMAYQRGRYATQLEDLTRVYPREQVLVLQIERCIEQPLPELARTYRFLGLDDGHVPDVHGAWKHSTVGRKAGLDDRRRGQLVELYCDEVRRLAAEWPQIDVERWPNFVGRL